MWYHFLDCCQTEVFPHLLQSVPPGAQFSCGRLVLLLHIRLRTVVRILLADDLETKPCFPVVLFDQYETASCLF